MIPCRKDLPAAPVLAALLLLLLLAGGGGAAQAGSQSSNSSSNCSDGSCTTWETRSYDDGRRRHGWTSYQGEAERPARWAAPPRAAPWHRGDRHWRVPPREREGWRRGGRDDDD
jgi:hypothetical protein